MKTLTICMYGAASDKIDSPYLTAGENLGYEIARRGHRMIYGAGATGMMGACARGMKKGNGEIIGVFPVFMDKFEPCFKECSEIIRTQTMMERKAVMEERADAFIICPGGIGTMDEFFQIITLVELERKKAPVILYNFNGFYDSLIEFIRHGIETGFIRGNALDYFYICTAPIEILNTIEGALER